MMPTTNVRKHVVPLGTEVSLTRQVIYTQFGESIHDVVPVSGVTARSQLLADMVARGIGPSASNPLVVHRADARGLHRIEYTTGGDVWAPASGLLDFPTKSAADSWATANPGMLTLGDEATIPGGTLWWNGTKWIGGEPASVTFRDIYSASGVSPVRIHHDRGWAQLEGRIVSTSAAFVAGTTYYLGDLPTGWRPQEEAVFGVSVAGTSFARLLLQPNGNIRFNTNASFTAALDMGVSGLRWRL